MKKIILSEAQSQKLAKILNEAKVEQMPVDKKMNKPFCINPDKVLTVKRYLDGGFTPHDFERVGPDGYPEKIKVITMNASNGQPLKPMYQDQLVDLLIDRFQNMFLDKTERELFMNQVVKDWLNNRISVHGILSVNALNESVLSEMTSSEISAEAKNTDTDPTEKQKEAGNYRMGHVSVKGMGISIENPAGSVRKGVDEKGNPWSVTLKNHYGYFKNTSGNGKDGDAVDVFIGPHPDDFDKVYVVDQKVGGEFDESKVMLGFYSKKEAQDAYMSNFTEGWNGLWKITGVSLKTFKKWLYRERKQRKPFADYVAIRRQRLEEGRINEEDYSEIIKLATMFDEKGAIEACEELRANDIDAYNKGNVVYIMVERNWMDPSYVDDVKQEARNIINDYMKTHIDSVKFAMNESMSISKLEADGWHIVRNEHGEANLLNDETKEFASEIWYRWISYPKDGYAIVCNDDGKYNIINLKGRVLLPDWHDDVLDLSPDFQYVILDGGFEQQIDIRDYDE